MELGDITNTIASAARIRASSLVFQGSPGRMSFLSRNASNPRAASEAQSFSAKVLSTREYEIKIFFCESGVAISFNICDVLLHFCVAAGSFNDRISKVDRRRTPAAAHLRYGAPVRIKLRTLMLLKFRHNWKVI